MKRAYPQNKCCICGKFVKWNADNSTSFGSYDDDEPPEPEFYCASCAKKEYIYYKERGWVPSDWIPAKWQIKLARELDLVRAGPIGAAWSRWYKPKDVLEGYMEWNLP